MRGYRCLNFHLPGFDPPQELGACNVASKARKAPVAGLSGYEPICNKAGRNLSGMRFCMPESRAALGTNASRR